MDNWINKQFSVMKFFSVLASTVLVILIITQLNRQALKETKTLVVEVAEQHDLDIVFGENDAQLSVYVYASYQCSYCRLFMEEVMPALLKKYKGELKFILRLTRHTNDFRVKRALSALVCVHKYGNYTHLHELLLNNYKVMYTQEFQTMVSEFAERDAFVGECMDAGAAATYLADNISEFDGLKLPGTPCFVVNGRVYAGFRSVEQFQQIIEKAKEKLQMRKLAYK
ncbi:MAG: thioredoxin domain-containing protein [Salinivirgaceae bacterium]|jgi:protein-disulfide isomerase|nr:thioredoxin domain-containing protein [Salinivirgaceae bacterium]